MVFSRCFSGHEERCFCQVEKLYLYRNKWESLLKINKQDSQQRGTTQGQKISHRIIYAVREFFPRRVGSFRWRGGRRVGREALQLQALVTLECRLGQLRFSLSLCQSRISPQVPPGNPVGLPTPAIAAAKKPARINGIFQQSAKVNFLGFCVLRSLG